MIKKYLEFIKESYDEKLKISNFWKLSIAEIQEYFRDAEEDGGFDIKVSHGFFRDDVFTQKVISGESIIPAYKIEIEMDRYKDVDVTDTLLFAHDIIKDKADADIIISDDGGVLDIDDIKLQGGIYITGRESDTDEIEAEGNLVIVAIQKENITIDELSLAKFYNWSEYEIKENKVYMKISIGDLADILIKGSNYIEMVKNGMENMWDNYYSNDYQPDIQDLFNYKLDKENIDLAIKVVLKDDEEGILETIPSEVKEDSRFNTEFLIIYIKKLLLERYNGSDLREYFKDSEIISEIRQLWGDYEMDAHAYSNYEDILKEFDRIVGKEFEYEKIEIEHETFFLIHYDNSWIDDQDLDDIMDNKLTSVFNEWAYNCYFDYKMDPNFSDYGDCDDNEVNKEVSSILKSYLKIKD